jgi:hypothetical protein
VVRAKDEGATLDSLSVLIVMVLGSSLGLSSRGLSVACIRGNMIELS